MQLLPVLSLIVALASFLVSYLAWRRTGVFKVRELRLRLGQDLTELGVLLDATVTLLASARQSHINVLAMQGLGRSGAEQIFVKQADDDAAELRRLREELSGLDSLPNRAGYAVLEARLVSSHGVRTRIGLIRDRITSVLVQDDRAREARRAEITHRAGL
jgi:hypothetical protein